MWRCDREFVDVGCMSWYGIPGMWRRERVRYCGGTCARGTLWWYCGVVECCMTWCGVVWDGVVHVCNVVCDVVRRSVAWCTVVVCRELCGTV